MHGNKQKVQNMKFITPITLALGLCSGLALGVDRPDTQTDSAVEPAKNAPAKVEAMPMNNQAKPGWLGVVSGLLPDVARTHLNLKPEQGVVVYGISPDSPAAKAGLQPNDIILSLDGNDISNPMQLRKALAGKIPGAECSIDYLRAGKNQNAKITLGERPAGMMAMRGVPFGIEGNVAPQAGEGMPNLPQALLQRLGKIENEEDMQGLMDQIQGIAGEEQQQHFKRMMDKMDAARMQLGQLQQQDGVQAEMLSTATMVIGDEQGAIELKTTNGITEIKVKNKKGEVTYEGPYNNADDRNKIPADVLARLDKLNIQIGQGGIQLGNRGGMKLQFGAARPQAGQAPQLPAEGQNAAPAPAQAPAEKPAQP